MDYAAQLSMVLPEIVLSVGGLALLMIAAWGGQAVSRLVSWVAVLVLIGAGVALTGPASSGGLAFDKLYNADLFGAYAKVLIFFAAAISIVIAPRFFARTSGEDLRPEYPILILFATAGMGMMVSANDLLTLYVGLELNSLASYVLASFMRRDVRSAEAGLKYFILGSLASGILLYGISLVYGFSGTTIFGDIATAYAGGEGAAKLGLLFGLVFMFAGFAFKMSAVPFHMWTPDVYEGAPTPVTTFFASAPKVAAVALAVRVAIDAMGPVTSDWRQIVIVASLASMALGSFAAIGQTNIKRLMAYSSIGHMGFALVGLASGTVEGAQGVLMYIVIYVAMTLGSFAIILAMKRNGQAVEQITDFAGLSRTNPLLAFMFAMLLFSLAGIPPLAGFFAKWYVFVAAIKANLFTLAVIGVLTSVVGAYYYLAIVKTMYFDEPAGQVDPVRIEVRTVLAVAGLFNLLFALFAGPVVSVASAAAKSLF